MLVERENGEKWQKIKYKSDFEGKKSKIKILTFIINFLFLSLCSISSTIIIQLQVKGKQKHLSQLSRFYSFYLLFLSHVVICESFIGTRKDKSVADSASTIWTQDMWPQEEGINVRQANIQQMLFKSITTLMNPKIKVCFFRFIKLWVQKKQKVQVYSKNRREIRVARKCRGLYKLYKNLDWITKIWWAIKFGVWLYNLWEIIINDLRDKNVICA